MLSRCILFLCVLMFVAPAFGARQTVVVFGDSLSAGYGLARGEGWVDLLARRVQQDRLDYDVVNASISGETTLGGRNRIADVLARHRPAAVVIELGANDGLRGTALETTRDNLTAIAAASRQAGARVLVVGMRIPPNYGPAYTRGFESLFADVARQQKATLVPFLLDGFAEQRDMFQSDGIHPTAAAQPRMLDNVYRRLRPLLQPRPG